MSPQKTGVFIAKLRKESNMTQQELAEKLNVTAKAISRWETGKGYPDVTILPEIAKVLNVSVNEILNGEHFSKEVTAEVAEKTILTVCHQATEDRQRNRRALIRVSVITMVVLLILEVVFAGWYYLFEYDRGKPLICTPQIWKHVLEEGIQQIEPLTEDLRGELLIAEEDFEGIIIYGAGKSTSEEIEESKEYFDSQHDYTHIVFADDSYEVYVKDVWYTSIIEAWQYGWWDRHGNMYALYYGHDAAKNKPNYRYLYEFWIIKNNDSYYMRVFCNNDNANTVFSACIDSMDKWEPVSEDLDD